MRTLVALLFALTAVPAFAHPGHGDGTIGFMAGLIHPFSGIDHLLAMLAVGLWSATTTRRVWLLPLCFASVLLLGALLAISGFHLPVIEPAIAASVLVFGMLVMVRVRLPEPAPALLVAAFALFHGAAHGTELGVGGALVGMVVATTFLHGIGLIVGFLLRSRSFWWQRAIGAGISLGGVTLVLNVL